MKFNKSKMALTMLVAFSISTSLMPLRNVEANSTDGFVKPTIQRIRIKVNGKEVEPNNTKEIQVNNDSKVVVKNESKIVDKTNDNTNNDDVDYKLKKIKVDGEKKDTDKDGISDSREIMIGTNPNSEDSNGNGIKDVDEVYNTQIGVEGYEKDPNIDVSIACNIKGENVDDIILTNMEGSHQFITKDIPGYIGAAFRVGIYKENINQEAKVTFKVNQEVANGKTIALYEYNKNTQELEEVKDAIINNNEIILNTTLTHNYKEYVVLNKKQWKKAWNKKILSPNTKFKECDVVLAVDKTVAEENNEIIKTQGQEFINGIAGENKEAVVDFHANNSIVEGLTNDKSSLTSAINSIASNYERELKLSDGLKYAIKAVVPGVVVSEREVSKSNNKTNSKVLENKENNEIKAENNDKVNTNIVNKNSEINAEKNVKVSNEVKPNNNDNVIVNSEKSNEKNVKENNEIKVDNKKNVNANIVNENSEINTEISNEKNVSANNVKSEEVQTEASSTKSKEIVTEYTNLPEIHDNKDRYIILFSDDKADIDINDPSIVYAKNNGIKIFTVALGNNANKKILRMIAKETGGEFLNNSKSKKKSQLLDELSSKVVDLITDTDGDGIPDYYESNLRLINGVMLKLDPNNPDTDGDGLGDELELIGKEKDVNAFRSNYNEDKQDISFNSRPDLVDTDSDEIDDGQDAEPKKKNVTTTTLLKFADLSYQELKKEYIGNKVKEIQGRLGNSYYNGDISRADVDKWNIIDLENGKGYTAGFGALAIVDGRNLIVAYPGTGADLGDLAADVSIATGKLGNTNYQTTPAKDFIAKVLKKLKGKIDNVFVTGHSLGGYLAQYAVYQCTENNLEDKTLTRDIEMKGVTFNSARFASRKALDDKFRPIANANTPSKDVFGDEGKYKDIVTNYRIAWDPISSSYNGSNLGKTVELADKVRWDMIGLGPHYIYNFYKHFS